MNWRVAPLLLILCTTAFSQSAAPKLTPFFTPEQLYERALATKRLGSGDVPRDQDERLKLAFLAGEFKGYIAGQIDGSQPLAVTAECTAHKTISQISVRTANILAQAPVDRSDTTHIGMWVAIMFACDESKWKK